MVDDDTLMTDRDRAHERYATCVARGLRDEADLLAVELGLTVSEVDAHFRVGHHADSEWQPENFEDFTALPPGRFDRRVFDQTVWWVDMLRQPHLIADPDDFTSTHLAAVIEFVLREGWRWVDVPDIADDAPFTTESFRAGLVRNIEATPLMGALRAEADRRLMGAGRAEVTLTDL